MTLELATVRAEALFASHLSQTARPTRAQVAAAIAHAVRRYGGTRGCAGQMAAVYGDQPEIAVGRMCWARRVIAATYPGRP